MVRTERSGGGDAFIILTQLHLIEVYSSANGNQFNLHIIGIAVNKQN